ncbi:hypothetical protein [Oscillibacter sp.]
MSAAQPRCRRRTPTRTGYTFAGWNTTAK